MKRVSLIVLVLFLGVSVNAQDSTNTGNLTLSGFTDVYYSYNTNDPGLLGNWGTNGVGRIFDGQHNQIAFNMLQTKLTYESDRLEIVGDLLFGPGAGLANFGNTGTAISIKQAYLAYGFCDDFTFTIGQFGTHIGYELVDAPDNFHYSLSYLFGNGPFYHTGAKVDYAASDKIGFMVGVLNGWDNLVDNNLAKSYAAQVSLTPNDNIGIYLNWIGGDEDSSVITGDSLSSFKQMTDLTAYFAVSDKFNVGINAAFGVYDFEGMETMNWGGAALYLDYALCDSFALGGRAEFFDDVSGVQYVGAAYMGYTLTGVIKAADDRLLIKPEIRYDSSNESIYFSGDSGSIADNQTTFGISFIGKY